MISFLAILVFIAFAIAMYYIVSIHTNTAAYNWLEVHHGLPCKRKFFKNFMVVVLGMTFILGIEEQILGNTVMKPWLFTEIPFGLLIATPGVLALLYAVLAIRHKVVEASIPPSRGMAYKVG